LGIGRSRQLPNPENCSLDELRQACDCCPDRKAQKRLDAVHLLLCGGTFELTMQHSGVSERCLQLWIKCFNDAGIDGITYRPRSGRPRALAVDEVSKTILPVVDDPRSAGRHHWTAVSLCGWLKEERDLEISYRTLVRYLHEHDYARRIPRPVPEPPDKEAWQQQREEFVPRLLGLLEDPEVEVFFGDEAGFEGDPRPRQRWVKRASRPTQGYYGGHVRQNVIGAVSPSTGRLVSLIVPHCDTEVFQAFLDTTAKENPASGRRVCLVLDNASWHKTKGLEWHHIEKVFLPPYSPDFNPIERLWQHLKGHGMAGFFTRDGETLSDKLCESIQELLDQPELIRSVCALPRL
jgi:transposase